MESILKISFVLSRHFFYFRPISRSTTFAPHPTPPSSDIILLLRKRDDIPSIKKVQKVVGKREKRGKGGQNREREDKRGRYLWDTKIQMGRLKDFSTSILLKLGMERFQVLFKF